MRLTSPQPRRWIEQCWAIDNIIQSVGIDWDQPRSIYWNAPCGFAASSDFAVVRRDVKKIADFSIAFEEQATRREAKARAAMDEGHRIDAREQFFIAAIHWGAAQWPIYSADDQNRRYNGRKRQCYTDYAALSDHSVEGVAIPFGDAVLRAWLRLPVGYERGRIPAIVSFPGMDSFKEASVALYGDPLLNRGFAVLSVDGPGQWEAPLDGVYLTTDHWARTGTACLD